MKRLRLCLWSDLIVITAALQHLLECLRYYATRRAARLNLAIMNERGGIRRG